MEGVHIVHGNIHEGVRRRQASHHFKLPKFWRATVASIDTVVYDTGRFEPTLRRELLAAGAGDAFRDRTYYRDGRPRGWAFTVHRPSPAAILLLDRRQRRWRHGIISQFAVALDLHTVANRDMKTWMERHGTVSWRRRNNKMYRHKNTQYWIEQWSRKRISSRDLDCYLRLSKITKARCCRVELKQLTAEGVKQAMRRQAIAPGASADVLRQSVRAQIVWAADLLQLDPAELFRQRVRLLAYPKQGKKRAQDIQAEIGRRGAKEIPLEVLGIPSELSWYGEQ